MNHFQSHSSISPVQTNAAFPSSSPVIPPANRATNYEILQGDCINVLRQFEGASFDMVLTDPPYIVGYKDRSGRQVANDNNDEWLTPAFTEIYRVLKDDSVCVSFYGWTQTDRFFAAWKAAGFRIVGHITFPKRYTSTVRLLRYQHESAYLLAKGNPPTPNNVIGDVIDWGVYTGNKLHPTQKPVSILLPLIQSFTRPGAKILDPFCGSGSTLAASLMCGRRAVGIELAEANARTASDRLARIVASEAYWTPVSE